MTRTASLRSLLFALYAAVFPAHAVGLPDTGQVLCYDDAGVAPASIAADDGSHPGQDCRFGRDAAAAAGVLTKSGSGAKGFDYTKIANNGSVLAAGASLGTGAADWACTRDNVTGLTWEVKTAASSSDVRHWVHTYAWYSTDGATNGGNPGSTGGNGCSATLPGSACNTQALVTAVNAAGLCGQTDWRLPTRRELATLVDAGTFNPAIDATYFPNTQTSHFYWSATTIVLNPANAWYVLAGNGSNNADSKTLNGYARLVRGGRF